MKFYKTKEFKKLEKKWYKKLESNGFENIEDSVGRLKEWSSRFYLNHNNQKGHKIKYEDILFKSTIKTEYYRRAEQFLHSHTFNDKLEKEIWRMHSEGISCRAIAKKINRPKYKKDAINEKIRALAKMMTISDE